MRGASSSGRQHVLITGASSGIGEALAREYNRAGALVTLVARRRDRLEAIAKELSGPVHIIDADLSETDRAEQVAHEAQRAVGPVDVLINNAGQQIIAPALRHDPVEAERMVRLDLLAPLRLTLAVLPQMVARRTGTVVDVASMAGITPTPGMYYYSAAKAGLAAASDVLRAELRGTGVHVLAVFPGPVETPMGTEGRARYVPSWVVSAVPFGSSAKLAGRVRRAVERKQHRLVYPRLYTLGVWFPVISKWVTARFTPPMVDPGAGEEPRPAQR